MTKIKKTLIAAVACGVLAIGSAAILGVDDTLKLFSGVTEIVKEVE